MPLNRELPEYKNLTKREREIIRLPVAPPRTNAVEHQAERVKSDKRILERVRKDQPVSEWE